MTYLSEIVSADDGVDAESFRVVIPFTSPCLSRDRNEEENEKFNTLSLSVYLVVLMVGPTDLDSGSNLLESPLIKILQTF